MKINKSASIQLATVLLAAGLANSTGVAADIDWGIGAQNITGDSDVSTAGTLVDAFAFGTASSAVATTVNGVTFAPFAFPSYADGITSTSLGNYAFSLVNGGYLDVYNNLGTGTGAYASLSSSYASLLGSGASATSTYGDGPLLLTISGLTVGQSYQFQWWDNNSSFTASSADGYMSPYSAAEDSDGNYVILFANDLSNVGSLGQYAIGTFTADNVTEDIYFDANGDDDGDMIINAFQLRDITATPAPEPSTLALAAMGGLGSLLMFRRRK